jgi:uncharacterized membrane protein
MGFRGAAPVGTAIGALSAYLRGYGIDDDFIKQVHAKRGEGVPSCCSAR